MKRLAAYAALAALVTGTAIVACETPAILHPGEAPPCGWHAVDCGRGRCCYEGDFCNARGECEADDSAGARRDAGDHE